MPDSPRYVIDERLRVVDTMHANAPLSLADITALLNHPVDLVGKKEAGEIMGRHPNNLGRIAGFPAPEWTLGATPVWQRDTIETFKASLTATVED